MTPGEKAQSALESMGNYDKDDLRAIMIRCELDRIATALEKLVGPRLNSEHYTLADIVDVIETHS